MPRALLDKEENLAKGRAKPAVDGWQFELGATTLLRALYHANVHIRGVTG
jgi:hypothetical protein